MSYAIPSDLYTRYDSRRVGELVNDDGTRSTTTQLDSNATALAVLADASSMIDAAVLAGNRYLQSDLAALVSDPNGGPFLKRLTCDLAWGLLNARRGYTNEELAARAPMFARALDTLDKLHDGERVFEIAASLAAGKPLNAKLSSHVTLLTSNAQRYFGVLGTEGGDVN